MPFDGLFMYAVCQELNEKLQQGRIEKIYQPGREELVLVVSRPGERYRLLLHAGAENARVHLTEETRPNPTAPPVFCMLLRKHLEGYKISGFRQRGLDRVLDIAVDCRDELGRPAVKSLVCEVMGRHSNIILVSRPDNIILDGIKRYTHAVSRHREVLPGQPYIPPPAQGKINPFSVTEEDFRELLLAGRLDDSLAAIMHQKLDGLSTATCREIVNLGGLEPDTVLNYCGEHELRSLWRSLQGVLEAARAGSLRATLVCRPDGEPVDFFPLAVAQQEGLHYITGGANETADEFFSRKEARETLRRQRKMLLDRVKKECRRVRKKLQIQKNSLHESGKAEQYRLYGELITANLHRLRRGMREIELQNYHDPQGQTVVIPLRPELSGPENAQLYFKKYNKAKNTAEAARKMIATGEEELQYLESVATALEMASGIAELQEIKQELASQGYINEPPVLGSPKHGKSRRREHLEPLSYISSDGFTVLVGRNNRQNDALTLKTADDSDIWLHTCKIPGAHVIIRTGGRQVPERTLLEAASLAAYYSRARDSANVPVDYTLCKHVKKPSGARPGFVIYEQQKTIFVNPRPDAMRPAGPEH